MRNLQKVFISVTDNNLIKRDAIFLLVSSLVATSLFIDGFISRLDGFVLVMLFVLYIAIFAKSEYGKEKTKEVSTINKKTGKIFATTFLTFSAAGIVMYFGAEAVVYGAKQIVNLSSLSQNFVGTVIIGLATIIPNAAVIISAARAKQFNLSFANLIGDSLASIPLTIGLISVFYPLTIADNALFLIPIFAVVNAIFFVMIFSDLFRLKFVGDPDVKNEEAFFLVLVYLIVTYLIYTH